MWGGSSLLWERESGRIYSTWPDHQLIHLKFIHSVYLTHRKHHAMKIISNCDLRTLKFIWGLQVSSVNLNTQLSKRCTVWDVHVSSVNIRRWFSGHVSAVGLIGESLPLLFTDPWLDLFLHLEVAGFEWRLRVGKSCTETPTDQSLTGEAGLLEQPSFRSLPFASSSLTPSKSEARRKCQTLPKKTPHPSLKA